MAGTELLTEEAVAGGVAAVILAGGRGERLGGRNKALIEVGGVRLIDRVRAAVHECEPMLIAAGRISFTLAGLRSVADLDGAYAGPLAGLAAAVAALEGTTSEWLLSVAVDTPFFPGDFRARAAAMRDDADVVIASYAGQDYPTNALWRLSALRALPDGVRRGTAPHSLKRLAAGLRSRSLDYTEVVKEDPFANVNTPEDLANLRLREARTKRG